MEPFPAYPCGNSWDEAFGKMGSGQKFYHSVQGSATGYKGVSTVGERTLMSAVVRESRVYRH